MHTGKVSPQHVLAEEKILRFHIDEAIKQALL